MIKHLFVVFTALLSVSACASRSHINHDTVNIDGPPLSTVDLSNITNAKPRYEALGRYGNPESYIVRGKRYTPQQQRTRHKEKGIASWYGRKFHGRLTSSREPYDMLAMTAAHTTLPLPSYVTVTNLLNNKKIIVRVNDRGPFAENRIIDLSYAAATKLGMIDRGTAPVEIEVILQPIPEHTIKTAQHQNIYIQTAAFSKRSQAIELSNKLNQFLTTRVTATYPQGKALYRVRSGPFSDYKTARMALKNLSEQGYNARIVNLPP